jgi:hypothetical protein
MIQRVQSIYLFIASVITVLLFTFNIWTAQTTDGTQRVVLNIVELTYSSTEAPAVSYSMYWLSILTVIIAIGGFATVFLYKNRNLQLKLVRLNLLLLIVLLVLIFYYIEEAKAFFIDVPVENIISTFDIGIYLPLVSIIFFFLASRGISADDRLVRSADRLR